jgi:hypothetical protein
MTKEQIVIGLSDALRVEINGLNKPDDRIYALNYRRQMEAELLRRLDEIDALRKENEELKAQNLLIRGDNADLLANADAHSFNLSNASADLFALRNENKTLTGLLHNFAKELLSLRKERENIKILLATVKTQLAWLANAKNYNDPAFDPAYIADAALDEINNASQMTKAKESEASHE